MCIFNSPHIYTSLSRSDSCSPNMKLGLSVPTVCVQVYFRHVCAYALSNRWRRSGHAPAEISSTFRTTVLFLDSFTKRTHYLEMFWLCFSHKIIQLVIIHAVASSKLDLVRCLLQSWFKYLAGIHLMKRCIRLKYSLPPSLWGNTTLQVCAKYANLIPPQRHMSWRTGLLNEKSENDSICVWIIHYFCVFPYFLCWCTVIHYLSA